MKLWVVVPAAGLGQRFNDRLNSADPPKQYQLIHGKPVISHTLERLLAIEPEHIVVAVHPQDTHWQTLGLSDTRITFTEGGAERSESVRLALVELAHRAQADDLVLVHDVARPCITSSDIRRLIELAGEHPAGGILATAITDTVKRVDRSGLIEGTEDRDSLWAAMTPQLFRYELLCATLDRAKHKGLIVSDEASALEALGYRPRVVAGRRDNIKLTYREDLFLAEAIITRQQEGLA